MAGEFDGIARKMRDKQNAKLGRQSGRHRVVSIESDRRLMTLEAGSAQPVGPWPRLRGKYQIGDEVFLVKLAGSDEYVAIGAWDKGDLVELGPIRIEQATAQISPGTWALDYGSGFVAYLEDSAGTDSDVDEVNIDIDWLQFGFNDSLFSTTATTPSTSSTSTLATALALPFTLPGPSSARWDVDVDFSMLLRRPVGTVGGGGTAVYAASWGGVSQAAAGIPYEVPNVWVPAHFTVSASNVTPNTRTATLQYRGGGLAGLTECIMPKISINGRRTS